MKLGYLAACLRKENVDVRIHNPVIPGPAEQIISIVGQWKPDILGLSAFRSHVRSITPLLGALISTELKPLVIIGSPHVSPPNSMLISPS